MSAFVPDAFVFQEANAVEVTESTLLGGNNCFSVVTDQGKHYRIVNFYLDSGFIQHPGSKKGLETLLKEGLTWPIKIAVLSERIACINDPRIPDSEYRDEFCEVCCPQELLPMPQRLRKARRIASGKVSFSKTVYTPKGETEPRVMLVESCVIRAD